MASYFKGEDMVVTRKMVRDHVTFSKEMRDEYLKDVKYDPALAVNIGCGNDYIDGWFNIDADPDMKSDILCNLDREHVYIPLPDNSMDLVYAMHILEHIRHLPELKHELCRILKPGGEIWVGVPHYLSPDAWGDDTHCRAFSMQSFFRNYWPGFSRGYKYREIPVTNPYKEEAISKGTFRYGVREDSKWILVSRSKGE